MNGAEINNAISRISHEIIEKNKSVDDLIIIGIQRRGVSLAKRIAKKIFEFENKSVNVGILDITLYRDDLSLLAEHPVINGTYMDFVIDNKKVVVVDDVIYTGRTVRAAIDAIMDIGRPKVIQLAILIDRGHREIPIKANFVGKNCSTSKNDIVKVNMAEFDGEDFVYKESKDS
jgi:pyrimidine operon attenuation protein/uracil phosphoribosyltransferase